MTLRTSDQNFLIQVRNGVSVKDFGQSNVLECVVVLLWCIMWLEMEKERGREPDMLHISVKRA